MTFAELEEMLLKACSNEYACALVRRLISKVKENKKK